MLKLSKNMSVWYEGHEHIIDKITKDGVVLVPVVASMYTELNVGKEDYDSISLTKPKSGQVDEASIKARMDQASLVVASYLMEKTLLWHPARKKDVFELVVRRTNQSREIAVFNTVKQAVRAYNKVTG
jgi:hypothetical protein